MAVSIPNPPSHFDEYAKSEWFRRWEELASSGRAAFVNHTALAAYCAAYSRWSTAEEQIARLAATPESRGALVAKSKDGKYVQNPYIAISS